MDLLYASNIGTDQCAHQLFILSRTIAISHFFCIDALCPSQQFFSHVGTISCFPGFNQYAADKGSCSRTQNRDSAGGESQTSKHVIPSLMLYHLNHCTPHQISFAHEKATGLDFKLPRRGVLVNII